MARWGDGLFESDDDLDTLSYISEDAGIEVYHYELEPNDVDSPELGFGFGGKGLEATREHLNKGIFKSLFTRYAKDRYDEDDGFITPRIALLAACAMRVGATVEPDQMKVLRRWCRFEFCGNDQLKLALKHYKNDGSPYNFDSMGLFDTAAAALGKPEAKRCHGPGCAKYEYQLVEGQQLSVCGRCKMVHYCGKECQTADWATHKKVCKAQHPTA